MSLPSVIGCQSDGDMQRAYVPVTSESCLFSEVTARVPMTVMERFEMAERLPFLVKLSTGLSVNILIGEEDTAKIKNYSFLGSLDSIIVIQSRVNETFKLPSPYSLIKDKLLGPNHKTQEVKNKAVLCEIVTPSQFTNSGKNVPTPGQSTEYEYDGVMVKSEISNSGDHEVAWAESETSGYRGTGSQYKNPGSLNVGRKPRHGKRGRPRKSSIRLADSQSSLSERDKLDCRNKQEQEVENIGEEAEEDKADELDHRNKHDENVSESGEEGEKPDMTAVSGTLGDMTETSVIGTSRLEELARHEKDPLQRLRLQKLLYEQRTPNKFQCKFCSYSCKRASHMQKHELVHQRKNCRVLACPHCDFRTIRRGKLQQHTLQCGRVAGWGEKVTCSQCDYQTDSPEELNAHVQETHLKPRLLAAEKSLKCSICAYSTDKPRMLNRHMASHLGPGTDQDGKFRCWFEGCDYKTMRKASLQFHVNGKHSDARPYLCDTCGTKFKRKHSLKLHVKFVHTAAQNKPLPFQCATCSKRFRSRAHLLEHQVKHTNARQHLCSTCGVAFKTKSAARRHSRTVHATPHTRPVCDYCRKPFNSSYVLQRHLRATDSKCGQAERLRRGEMIAEKPEESVQVFPTCSGGQQVVVDRVISLVSMPGDSLVPVESQEQVLTVEIPAVGQSEVLGEDVTLLQGGDNNFVVMPMDSMVIQQDSGEGELGGQQPLLTNDTLQGLLSGQLLSINPAGDSQGQLMYISTS